MPVKLSSGPIVLRISGIGHAMSFKNCKRMATTKDGRQFPVTEKRVKQWMNLAKASLLSQLKFLVQTECGETWMGSKAQSWIASSLPSDDCRQVICKLVVEDQQVEPGEEGVEIIIERC